jgi:hypothetical protein
MASVKSPIKLPRAVKLNLEPENPFDDYHTHPVVKLEGIRETAAALALTPERAEKWKKAD